MAAKTPSTIACPVCGNINKYDQEACLKCGTPLEPIRRALQSIKAGRAEPPVKPARPRSEPSRPVTEKRTRSTPPKPALAWWPWVVGAVAFVILAVVGIQLDWFNHSAVTLAPTPTLSPGSIQVSPVDGMQQVYIPAGTFQMGRVDYAEPVHTVTLTQGYWIDRTEVTNSQYALCVAASACPLPEALSSFSRPSYYDNPEYSRYPVVNVSWDSANAYCAWAGRRLPTEAEWEYAAIGNDGRHFPWGDEHGTCELSNVRLYDPVDEVCVGDTSAVGSYPAGASPFGVLDMAGNVWEWVNDWDGPYSAEAQVDPQGPLTGDARIWRGSGFSQDVYLFNYRMSGGAQNHFWYSTGFRCAENSISASSVSIPTPFNGLGHKACIVFAGSKDDRSVNALAWQGMLNSDKSFNLDSIDAISTQQQVYYKDNVIGYLDEGCDVIFTVGYQLQYAANEVAATNPDQLFAAVDSTFDPPLPNAIGSEFYLEQPAFLAGYLAAATSTTGKVGVYGGIQIPVVTALMDAYALGVEAYNSHHGTAVQVLGWDYKTQQGRFLGDFTNVDGAAWITNALLDEGADIILPVAGMAGEGTLEALRNRGTGLMVGVSVDWSIMYPEYSNYVLASAAMRSDRWIEDTILQVLDGTIQAGNDTADLASGYVDCVYGAVWADRIPVSLKAELDTLRADLISGRRSAKRP